MFFSLLSTMRNSALYRIALCFVCLMILIVFDLLTGPSGMTLHQVIVTLLEGPNGDNKAFSTIIWLIRLPQTLTAIAVGFCLGYAGLMMQTILANPLASPYTLGFSAAAGFGAALSILFGASLPIAVWILVPVSAFASTLLACAIIYVIAHLKGSHSEILVLAGIAVLFFFQSLQSLLQYLAAPEVLQQIVFWLFGSLLKANWTSVWVITAILAVTLPFSLKEVWNLTTLRLGDDNAASLGLNVNALRKRIFIHVALLTAAAVSFTGTIGFIGLISPHVSRAIVGEDHRYSLLLSGMIGSILLVSASILSKTISAGAVIPVGIITAIVGVPMLLIVILKKQG